MINIIENIAISSISVLTIKKRISMIIDKSSKRRIMSLTMKNCNCIITEISRNDNNYCNRNTFTD